MKLFYVFFNNAQVFFDTVRTVILGCNTFYGGLYQCEWCSDFVGNIGKEVYLSFGFRF